MMMSRKSVKRARTDHAHSSFSDEDHSAARLKIARRPQQADGPHQGWGPEPANACEPGHIMEVHVINFTCHHNFVFKFNPGGVSVINGSNGSGKTSVIDALQLCLGARSSATSRRNPSQSKYIRKGCQSAEIKVKLWNTPNRERTPYRFDKLGYIITIQRKIRASGANETLILDQNGSVKYSGKGEVENMVDLLNIDCSSVATVLNQEKAKSLLSVKAADAPGVLFQLFSDALGFTKMEEDYQCVQQNLTLLLDNARRIKQDQKAAQDELATLTATSMARRDLEHLEIIQGRVYMLPVWATIKMQEDKVQDLEQEVEQYEDESKRASVIARVEELQRDVADLEAALAQGAQREEALQRSLAATGDGIARKKKELHAASKQVQSAERQLKSKRDEIMREQQLGEELHARMQNFNNDADDERKQEWSQWEQRMRAKQTQLTESQAAVRNERNNIEPAEAAERQAYAAVEAARRTVASAQGDLNEKNRSIRQAQASLDHDPAHRFGGHHVQLRQLVARNSTMFKKPPIGPVGCYLKLIDEQWGDTLQNAIGSYYTYWICDNWDDKNKLLQLCRRHRVQTSGITVTTVDYGMGRDTPRPEQVPTPELVTALSCLVLPAEHETVLHNFLLRMANAERIVLVPDEQGGKQLLRQRNDLWAARRLKKVFSRQPLCEYEKRSGSEFIASIYRPNRNQLQKDNAAYLRSLEADQRGAQEQLSVARENLESCSRQLKEAQVAVRAHKQRLQRQQAAQAAAQAQVEEERANKPHADNIISIMDDEVDQSRQRVVVLETELQSVTNEMQVHQQRLAGIQSELQELQDAKKADHDEMDAMLAYRDELTRKQRKHLATIQSLQNGLHEWEQGRAKKAMELQDARQQAAELRELAGSSMRAPDQHGAQQPADPVDTRTVPAEAVLRDICDLLELHEWRRLVTEQDPQALYQNRTEDEMNQQTTTVVKLLKRKINEKERMLGGIGADLHQAELDRRVQAKKRKVEMLKVTHDICEKELAIVRRGYNARIELLGRNRKAAESTTSMAFRKGMRRLGNAKEWNGTVQVDFDSHQLHLTLKRKWTEGGQQHTSEYSSLSQLSGGERSFVGALFLLAIGQVAISPFFIMDEYDVFMDVSKRVATTTHLFKFAAQHRATQMVLVTPLDPAPVMQAFRNVQHDQEKENNPIPDEFVQIYKMPNPRPQ